MKPINKIGAVLIASAILLSSAATANAAPASTQTPGVQTASEGCLNVAGSCQTVEIINVGKAYVAGDKRFHGSPGANLTLSRGESSTVTGTMSVSTEVEAGVIFASASVQIGVSLSLSKTTSIDYSVSATVPAEGGYIELGAQGISFDWVVTKYSYGVPIKALTGTAVGATPDPYAYLSWVGYK